MKKLLPLIIILVILSIVAVVFVSLSKNDQAVTIVKGNMQMKALPLKVNFTHDSYCKMLITNKLNNHRLQDGGLV